MTNSFLGGKVKKMLLNFLGNQKKTKRIVRKTDVVTEQVRQVLRATDQKLILMVRH